VGFCSRKPVTEGIRRSAAAFVASIGAMPAVLTALTAGLACDGSTPEPAGPRPNGPNVVLIVVDTLRADRLSQMGYSQATSEALDVLGDRANIFRQAFSPAPWTVPSVTSIFTGLLPPRHRVDATGAALAGAFEVLPEVLARSGWHTAGFSLNPHVSREAGFDQGFQHFRDVVGAAADSPDLGEMLDEALSWVRDDAKPPFFLYLQPMNAHGPYRVPEHSRSALLGRPPLPGFEFRGELMQGILRDRRLELREQVTPAVLQSLNEQYDTAVRRTADELGRMLRELDAAGLYDDALVILTADHGEELFDRGGFAHGYTLNREVLQVPLFVKLPGQRSARSIEEPVSLVDLMPSVLDVLGLGLARDGAASDGRSLRPLLEGANASGPSRPILAQTISPKRCDGRVIREDGWELMVIDRNYESDEPQLRLYDIRRDPDQRVDLSAEQPERAKRLLDRLESLYDGFGEDAYPRSHYEIDPATRESLEALGYF
jgi:arylsulfatase A-like enzyme